jgi:ParB-like chromosome segregation protein Spo0J
MHEVIYMNPFELVPHEVNQSIYRDAPDDEFIESIKRLGVLEPILAMQPLATLDSDGGTSVRPTVVLSGHRRMNAARALELDEVPVIIQPEEMVETDDDAIRLLILSNRQRDKTNEQRAREFAVLKEVEERLAKERMRRGEPASGKSGRASDLAAEAVGMSGRTADRAVSVVEAIDEAEASGDEGRVDNLRRKLNHSVNKGHKAVERERAPVVDGNEVRVPENLIDTFKTSRGIRGLIYKIGEIKASARVISEDEGGELLPLRAIEADCTNVSNALIAARPHAVCPICRGNGCNECDQLGWMHRDQYNALPEGLRSTK